MKKGGNYLDNYRLEVHVPDKANAKEETEAKRREKKSEKMGCGSDPFVAEQI